MTKTAAAAHHKPSPPSLGEHWRRLQRQYAIEGYLHGLAHAAAARCGWKSGKAWNDFRMLEEVKHLAPQFSAMSSDQLAALGRQLREDLASGRPFDQVVPPAFALVRETSRRLYGLYHHDVQILAGLAMCRGAIAEMATGEGKTLVQSLVAFAWALHGRGVHLATANSYLAERDQEASVELLRFLGISSALLPEDAPPAEKRRAYAADVTFGTGTEFGFDYLRDQIERFRTPSPKMGERFAQVVLGEAPPHSAFLTQRGLIYAVLDEADSILVDEASTPLMIATKEAGLHRHPAPFVVAKEAVSRLREGIDYEPGDAEKPPRLTPTGEERIISGEFPVPWEMLRRPWKRYVENALNARYRFHRDVHYVVRDGKAVIIDEFTGRAREESSWKDGQHQAVEAKENLDIQAESESVAGISRQRFYKLYENLCGMTGTAMDSAGELWEVFRMPVVSIPRNRPSRAEKWPTRIFVSESAKMRAIVEAIQQQRAQGRAILVGTRTIGNSETLSAALTAAQIPHRVLNASQDSEEATIISEAGQAGRVTIATNMAGRGTHISLDPEVLDHGGLHVIALELEESRRIDLQLTGRGARQGQPGSHQAFLSADDFVLQRYLPDEASRLASARADENGEVRGSPWESVFFRAQSKAEKIRYASRQGMLRRDEWLSETKRRI